MLVAFVSGLLLITVSELGDKTFFIVMLLSMRQSHRIVLSAAIAALAAMTILSALLGHAVAFLPESFLHYGEIALFLGFGLKLLYDASRMSNQSICAVMQEAAEVIEEQPKSSKKWMRVLGWVQSSFFMIWLRVFSLVFIAEWGDRTQISTIALASSYPIFGVMLGAILGHSICAVIAVIGGKCVAGRLSERMLTLFGGILFLIFAIVAAINP